MEITNDFNHREATSLSITSDKFHPENHAINRLPTIHDVSYDYEPDSDEADALVAKPDDEVQKTGIAGCLAKCGPRLWKFAKTCGPGMVVMLADTDASCIITAADTGKEWGYSLILLQFILIPPLYAAQELTVRIGVVTGKGLGLVVKEQFGKGWAAFHIVTLMMTIVGGIISEMVSMAGLAQIFGLPVWLPPLCLAMFLMCVVLTGTYRRVEIVALILGCFELVYLITMIMSKPDAKEFGEGLITFPVRHTSYMLLLSANIGAVIMPWMIFYECSAVVDKKLTEEQIPETKLDTFLGACITQLIMASVVITMAATVWNGKYDGSSKQFKDVPDIAASLTPLLGEVGGKYLFSLGLAGGAMIGAIVLSLTGAWSLGEVTGFERSLETSPRKAPFFYLTYAVLLIAGLVIAVSGAGQVVILNVLVQTMNTILLPPNLTFLFLAARNLPGEHRLQGVRMYVYGITFFVIAVIGFSTGIWGIVDTAQNWGKDGSNTTSNSTPNTTQFIEF